MSQTFSFEDATAPPPAPAPSTFGFEDAAAPAPKAASTTFTFEDASAPPATTGSVAKDMAINAFGGGAQTLAGAGAAVASAVGADHVADSLDEIQKNWRGVQAESGGATLAGKASNLVGAVAPAFLLPAAKAAQLIGAAGLFAVPAFRETLKSQLDEGRSFPLALTHAAEAFGINLLLPHVATTGSAAAAKVLGADTAKGVAAVATKGAQAAGEGAAFSAANSVIDKGTDVIAGQQNDRDWIDLQDMAANALGFSALRAGHAAPQIASAVNDRLGSSSRQFGRAMDQDVQNAQQAPVGDAAASDAGFTPNPNLATTEAAPVQSIADRMLAIRPLQDKAKRMRDAGEDAVADELDRRANVQAADIELDGMPGNPPAFEDFYRTLRADGVMPAEASARAGMLGTFAQTSAEVGLTSKAVQAGTEKAKELPLAQVPQFLDKYVAALTSKGLGQPVEPGQIARTVGDAGEQAMHRAIDTLYTEPPAPAAEVSPPAAADTPAAEPPAPEPPASPGYERFAPGSGTLGLSRDDLPQIQGMHHGPMVNFLNARGVSHEIHELNPDTLKPSQAEFSRDKVRQLVGAKEGDGSILVSSDGYVLDGHHRWLAAKVAREPVKAIVLNAPIRELVEQVKQFPSADRAGDMMEKAGAAQTGDTAAAAEVHAGETGSAIKPDGAQSEPVETKPLSVGIMPGNAEPVTVKGGIVHIGKAEAVDFNSGEPVMVKAAASDAEIKQALKDAGALSRRQKFFGGERETTTITPGVKSADVADPITTAAPLFAREGEPLFKRPDLADLGKPALNARQVRYVLAPALRRLTIPHDLRSIEEARAATGTDIPPDAKGMYYKGTLHVFTDNLHSPLQAEAVFWHEVQHAGTDAVYGAGSKAYEQALRSIASQNANIREAAKAWMVKYGREDYHARIDAGATHEQALLRTKLQAVDEALAEMSSRNVKINGLPQFIAKVQEFLRSIGLERMANWLEGKTDAQALSMILNARAAVMKEPAAARSGQLAPVFDRDADKQRAVAEHPVGKDTGSVAGTLLSNARSDGGDGRIVNERHASEDNISFSRSDAADDAPDEKPQRKPYTGPGAEALKDIGKFAGNIKDDLVQQVAPMSTGSQQARAIAQKFANDMRAARHQWSRMNEMLKDSFTPEQRREMWSAADEQNTLLKEGKPTTGRGLDQLSPEQRKVMDTLHSYADGLWDRARDVGMVEGDGLPYWTPRVAVMIGEDGLFERLRGTGKTATSSGIGRNVSTTAPSAKHRKYDTTEESEAALKAKMGDKAEYVRDILTMPHAMGRFEQAIAGRELINQIREVGVASGRELVSSKGGKAFFTLDHPSFTSYKPRLGDDGKKVMTQDGRPVMDREPLFIDKEFEGPLKAVLSTTDGFGYRALMLLKSKSMSMIMASPLTHNMVIWGRALAYSPAQVGTGYLYWKGHLLAKDNALMSSAIQHGLVPIGANRNNMIEITDVARGIGRQGSWGDPNESWVNLSLQKLGNLVHSGTGDAIKAGADALGDFVHHTLLWKQVGALQVGIYSDAYQYLRARGLSDAAAGPVAAHLANRYAGAVGQENMSEYARKAANILLFSRSFNMGNVGAIKDIVGGLPAGLKAKLMEDAGEVEGKQALNFAKRKALTSVITEVGMSVLALSVVQSAVDKFKKGKDWDEIADGYVKRLNRLVEGIKDHPLDIAKYNPYLVSPTSENEPDKTHHVDMGPQPGGRHEYMRLPTGKAVEDLLGWALEPKKTLGAKLSPMAKGVTEAFSNDKGFGVPVKDPNGGFLQHARDIAAHLVESELPWSEIKVINDLVHGRATDLDKDKAAGFATGFSMSQGHPGGPKAAVAAKVAERQEAAKKYAMEEVRADLKDGDVQAARDTLYQAGFKSAEITTIIKRIQNPKSGMSEKARQNFNKHATEAERDTMRSVNVD